MVVAAAILAKQPPDTQTTRKLSEKMIFSASRHFFRFPDPTRRRQVFLPKWPNLSGVRRAFPPKSLIKRRVSPRGRRSGRHGASAKNLALVKNTGGKNSVEIPRSGITFRRRTVDQSCCSGSDA